MSNMSLPWNGIASRPGGEGQQVQALTTILEEELALQMEMVEDVLLTEDRDFRQLVYAAKHPPLRAGYLESKSELSDGMPASPLRAPPIENRA
jgi:hypothetical protein